MIANQLTINKDKTQIEEVMIKQKRAKDCRKSTNTGSPKQESRRGNRNHQEQRSLQDTRFKLPRKPLMEKPPRKWK